MTPKLRSFVTQLTYAPRTFHLIWTAARGWTLAWAVLLIVQGVLPAVTVYLTKLLVDSLVKVTGSGNPGDDAGPILLLAGLMAGIWLITQVLQGFTNWVRTAQAELVRDYLTALVHEKATAVDLAFYESSDYHDLLARARNDLNNRPLALLESSGSLVQSTITLLAMVTLLIPYGIWLPLVLLISTLPAFLIVLYFNRRYHRWWEQTTITRRWAAYYDMVLTHSMVAGEIRLFDLGSHFQSAFQTLRRQLRTEQLGLVKDQAWAQLGAAIIGLLATGMAIVWVILQVLQGAITLGDLTLFYQAFNRGQGLLRSLLQNVAQIYANVLFLGNLFRFLELEPRIVDPLRPITAPLALKEGIRFRKVAFRYPGSERPVLQDFNLVIPAGKVIAIVGANGAGKTTLFKLLCRFYDPEAGAIELDGHDLRELAVGELRQMITVLFQSPAPYFDKVAKNIALGDLAAAPGITEIEAAARSAGAHEFIMRLPQGYDTLLGKWFTGGTELSGGEWQRLALARAFLRQSQIMILDEPTSLLDSWAEIDWFERFRKLANGRTAIIITHRFTIAKDADIICVMDQGQIVESGGHEELLARGGLYAQSWIAQTKTKVDNRNTHPDLIRGELSPQTPSEVRVDAGTLARNRTDEPLR